MYYLFKEDPFGHKIPVFASQKAKAADCFAAGSNDVLYVMHTRGNSKLITCP